MLKIHLKDPANAELANQKLKELGWDYTSDTFPVVFNSAETVQWQFVDYYNSDAHLSSQNCIRIKSEMTQGEDRDVTAEECMKWWNIKFDGIGTVDISYDRCTTNAMLILVLFISGNTDLIEKVENGLELLEKSGMDTTNSEGQKILEAFQKLEYVYVPELLPEDERTDRSVQGGVIKAKYWGVAPTGDYVHVIYGNVETAAFMKDRQYKEDIHNNLYRCDDGRGVLLVPQLPIDHKAASVADAAFNRAWEMGVRENFYYFIHMVWKNCFEIKQDRETMNRYAESIKGFYNAQELKDRVLEIAKHVNSSMPLSSRLQYNPKKAAWNRFSYNEKYDKTMVALLNAMFYSLYQISKNVAAEAVEEIMTPEFARA